MSKPRKTKAVRLREWGFSIVFLGIFGGLFGETLGLLGALEVVAGAKSPEAVDAVLATQSFSPSAIFLGVCVGIIGITMILISYIKTGKLQPDEDAR